MTLARLNGNPCSRVRAQVPAWGLWWADVDTTEPVELARGDAATLTIADVTAVGVVASGGVHAGRGAYRVIAGLGGWSLDVSRRAYANDLGVRVDGVIRDAARDVGEAVEGVPDTRVGPHYTRFAGLASRVLHELAPQSWRVDFDGVTRFGSRASTTYTGDAPRVHVDRRVGVVDLATEAIGDLVPGVVVDGMAPASDVEYVVTDSRLTVRVYASASSVTRRLLAFSRILEALDPLRRYRGTYEFRVVTQSGERLNLQPVRAATGLPDLANVPVRPGMAGLRADVTPGSLVLVTFADADPSRPCVVAHDAPDAPGWMPLVLELGATPTLGVARQTDTVVAGPWGGTITGGSARIKAGS